MSLPRLVLTIGLVLGMPAQAAPVLDADFDGGADGFNYADNTFRGTAQAPYADGVLLATGGFSGGALSVILGGVNGTDIDDMSGGWSRTFNVAVAEELELTLRYDLNTGPDYESSEFSQVMVSLDG